MSGQKLDPQECRERGGECGCGLGHEGALDPVLIGVIIKDTAWQIRKILKQQELLRTSLIANRRTYKLLLAHAPEDDRKYAEYILSDAPKEGCDE